MEKSVIVIGAGLTGLSAGCYGRMNNYRTTILEMDRHAGGVCTAWERKGYTIDGAVNWVVGTAPDEPFHRFWEELGVAGEWTVFNHDRLAVVEDQNGAAFTVYCDADRLERHMLEIAPEDRRAIRRFTGAIRRVARFTMPADKPTELYGFVDMVKMVRMVPLMWFIRKWSRRTVNDFARSLQSPFLREVLPRLFWPDGPLFILFMLLGWQHRKAAGYIIGGAKTITTSLEKRYAELGGDIEFSARVEKILVEGDRAVGVRLADGREYRADWIISAADGRTTIFDMLDGRYVDDDITARYDHPKLFNPLIYIAFGMADTAEEVPDTIDGLIFPLKQPIVIAGKEETTMCVRTYRFDPTLAPAGRTVLVVQYETDYDYWRDLRGRPRDYAAEKERIASEVVAGLNGRFPGIGGRIEMTDVATPVTWERYTGNWRGSYEGWMIDAENLTKPMKKTLPGLDGLYMAGQWVNPGGGIPTAVMSGSHTVQLLCRRDGKSFTAAGPVHSWPRSGVMLHSCSIYRRKK